MIKDILNEWVASLPAKEYKTLSPSSLGGCPRAHYFKLKGVQSSTPPSPAALLNFQVGFLWEEIWEKALAWKGVEYKSQVAFVNESLNLGGTCDFLVKPDPEKDEWEIWDSKTQGSKWFWYVQSQIKRGTYNERKEEYGYILQQACYIMLAREAGYNVTKAKLAYVSKDDGFVGKITEIKLDDELLQEVVSRASYLNKCLSTNTLPACECEGWKVGYCNFGDPKTQVPNRTKKMVNSTCCDPKLLEVIT